MKNLLINLFFSILSIIRVARLSFPYRGMRSTFLQNKKIVVLGNGPSLSDSLLDMDLKESECIVVNNFVFTDYFVEYKPSYYVVIDPLFFTDIEKFDSLFRKLDSLVDWPINIYVPYAYKRQVKGRITNCNIVVKGLILTPIKGFQFVENQILKFGLGIPQAQNVLIAAIFISIQRGFKTIEIYGADNSWHKNIEVNNDNVVCLVDSHFYDTKKINLVPWLGVDEKSLSMKELFEIFAIVMDSYARLNRYAIFRGVEIKNYSKISYIDVFNRK